MDATSYAYFRITEGATLILVRGDVTLWKGDSLVNTCNQELTKTTGTNGGTARHTRGVFGVMAHQLGNCPPRPQSQQYTQPLDKS